MRYLYLLVILFPVLLFLNSCSSNDPTMYQLTIITIPEEGGMVTPDRTSFEEGREIEIFANPNEHWVFSEWDGDFQGTENNSIITMDSDKEIIARFSIRDYALTVEIEGEGRVNERVVPAKSTDYEYDTTVELTAVADAGWEFAEWEGDLSGAENPQTIVIEGDTKVTAVFERITFPLTVEIEGEGTVDQEVLPAKTTDYEVGTFVQLTAVPDADYLFFEWSGAIGDASPDSNPIVIEMDEAKTVMAEFREGFELSTVVVPEGAGTIEPGSGVFISGAEITVEASAEYGWRFVEWSGDITGTLNPLDFTVDADMSIEAYFERLSFQVSVQSVPDSGGQTEIELVEGDRSTESPGEYLYESVLELTAVPQPGWQFTRWEGDIGSADPAENPVRIEVTEAVEIQAVYSVMPGILKVSNITSGQGIPESYTVKVTEDISGLMMPNDTLTFDNLEPGRYSVELTDVPQTCARRFENPQVAVIIGGEETELIFEYICAYSSSEDQ